MRKVVGIMPQTFAPPRRIGEPAWEVAELFPPQGNWSEHDFLALNTNRLIELSDGVLEVPPTPTEFHQTLLGYLYTVIQAFVTPPRLGKVLMAGIRVRLWEGKFREPDVVFMLAENAHRRRNEYWERADLAIEIVSDDDPDRDWVIKKEEYARAGIREYWIVDPRGRTISVFTLDEGATFYRLAGRYASGERAASILLAGLEIDVDEVFAQE